MLKISRTHRWVGQWLSPLLVCSATVHAQGFQPGAQLPLEDPMASYSRPMRCLIEPLQVSELGSASMGILKSISVQRGDVVKQGQVLAELDSGVDQATLS